MRLDTWGVGNLNSHGLTGRYVPTGKVRQISKRRGRMRTRCGWGGLLLRVRTLLLPLSWDGRWGGASKELVSAVNNGRDFCVTCFRWGSKTTKKNIGQDGYSNGVRNSFGGVGRIRRQPSRIRVSLKDSIESRLGGHHAGQGPDREVSG